MKLAEALDANEALKKKIADFEAQNILDAEQAATLIEATQLLEARLGELEAINPNPVADGLGAEIVANPNVEAPEAIANDPAVGTGAVTAEETVETIAEAVPLIVFPLPETDEADPAVDGVDPL